MNILQILPSLNAGGVETGTVDLAKELARQGHKAVVISSGGKLVSGLTAAGALHYQLPVNRKNPFSIIDMTGKIGSIIKKEKIELVHVRSRAPAISAFFAAYIARVPFITTCHGYYSKHIFSRVMGWGRFVIVSSNVVARRMIHDFGVPCERIRLIPRGVDLENFKYKEPSKSGKKEYAIGIIGRITPIKGHVYLIRAISNVIRLMPNIKLLIIGDAPQDKPKYRQELESLVKRLSLSKYVDFLGERNDIAQQLEKLDMLVMPSIYEETFGRAIIEAQACGVPVIASRIGGIIDIIEDRHNGILVPPRDWDKLSEAILQVLKDKDLRARLSKAGRENVEKNYSLEHMYKKTIKIYNDAILSKRILIIKWSALGDIILSIPSIKAISERYPKADIAVLTSRNGRELMSRYPFVKEFYIFQNKKGFEGVREILDISSQIRRSCIDVSIDLQNNNKSRLMAFLAAIPRRIGYKSKQFSFLLSDAIKDTREALSPLEHQSRLLALLGINTKLSACQFIISPQELEYAEKLFQEGWMGKGEIVVGINYSSSRRWQTKRISAEKIARLCDILAQKKMRVILTGTKEDTQTAKKILSITKAKPLDITGKTTLMQLAAVINRCRAFITTDSSPMHLAAFLEVPFVALFGSTDPRRHLEPSKKYKLIYKKLSCSPCYKARCRHMKCMENIAPEEIAEAVSELLS